MSLDFACVEDEGDCSVVLALAFFLGGDGGLREIESILIATWVVIFSNRFSTFNF